MIRNVKRSHYQKKKKKKNGEVKNCLIDNHNRQKHAYISKDQKLLQVCIKDVDEY